MYRLIKDSLSQQISSVQRISDVACIPFGPANTDYQQFKKDLEEGAELQDADGKKMTKSKVTAFLKTLP